MEKTCINLASGDDYREGYINVDDLSMLGSKVDVRMDIHEFRIPRESADEILLSHFMMYLLPEQALRLFERWYFGLKKGGTLIIETSDLMKVVSNIKKAKTPAEINSQVVSFYGAGATYGHRWIWCEETITPLLRYVGFTEFSVLNGGSHNRPDRDITIIATK